mmetsp:Transcript_13007/g.33192  ORF Transcript_13007/g.33192 Transcript_13007/m.33192 type:complete len:237 (+) Transcript_13007:733-1443(+)
MEVRQRAHHLGEQHAGPRLGKGSVCQAKIKKVLRILHKLHDQIYTSWRGHCVQKIHNVWVVHPPQDVNLAGRKRKPNRLQFAALKHFDGHVLARQQVARPVHVPKIALADGGHGIKVAQPLHHLGLRLDGLAVGVAVGKQKVVVLADPPDEDVVDAFAIVREPCRVPHNSLDDRPIPVQHLQVFLGLRAGCLKSFFPVNVRVGQQLADVLARSVLPLVPKHGEDGLAAVHDGPVCG